MKWLIIVILCAVCCVEPQVYADEDTDNRIEELSTKVDQLNSELDKLAGMLQKLVEKDDPATSDTEDEAVDSGEAGAEDDLIKAEMSAEQKQIDELLDRIDGVVQTQKDLVRELDELKESNKPEPLYDEDGNEVYLGIVEDDGNSDAPVLEYYGNANDSVPYYIEDNDYYVVPEKRSRVGISFFFGSPGRRYYYDDWDGPWAVTPPWWVRRQYYRRKYGW